MDDQKRVNVSQFSSAQFMPGEIFVPAHQRKSTNLGMLLKKLVVIGIFLALFGYVASQGPFREVFGGKFENLRAIFQIGGGGMLSMLSNIVTANAKSIGLSLLIAVVLSALNLVLYRFCVGVIVWLMIVLIILVPSGVAIFLIVNFTKSNMQEVPTGAIIASIISVLLILFVVLMYKKITLAIKLMQEAAAAVTCMSKLLIVPFINSSFLCLVSILFFVFHIIISSSKIQASFNSDENPLLPAILIWYNGFVYLWFTQFLTGCQHMIVSGAVGKWYFTRDKQNLSNPVTGSVGNLLKFHLGTVATGSLVIIIINFVRGLMKSLKKLCYPCCCCCIHCCCCMCLSGALRFLEYLTTSAYIATSIFSLNFLDSGKKAFSLIIKHAAQIWTVQLLVKVVMFEGKLFVICTTLIAFCKIADGYQIDPPVYIFVGLVAYIVVQGFFDTYAIAVDAIIISFCADCELNDGLSKPYYMSEELASFLELTQDCKGGSEDGQL